MNVKLDSFEERLLCELRGHVATAEREPPETPFRGFSRSRVLRLVLAAFIVGVVLVVANPFSTPAYSVGEGNAGEIFVEINRPEDAAGLEQALTEYGIAADITYLSDLQTCAPGRYTVVDRDVDVLASIGEEHISVTLSPGTVREGETFVLTWSVEPFDDEKRQEIGSQSGESVVDGFSTKVTIDVAAGPVAPCQPVAR